MEEGPHHRPIRTSDFPIHPSMFTEEACRTEKPAEPESKAGHEVLCEGCGRTFNTGRGLSVHKRSCRHINTTASVTPSTSTAAPAYNTVATLTSTTAQSAPEVNLSVLSTTTTTTNTSTARSAATTLPACTAHQSTTGQPVSRTLRPRRPRTGMNENLSAELSTCCCGRQCLGLRGLSTHQRSCKAFGLLVSGAPLQNDNTAQGVSVTSQAVTTNGIRTADQRTADHPTAVSNSSIENKSSNINISCSTASPSSPRDRPGDHLTFLDGIKLPSTGSDWSMANDYFHSSDLFSYVSGSIVNLDKAVEDFNRTVYNYFRDNYGQISKKHSIPSNQKFEEKYRDFSRSRLKRSLMKLKRSEQFAMGSTLHEEIRFLARRIRDNLDSRSTVGALGDKDFGKKFWDSCSRAFCTITNQLPTFSIADAFHYFLRIPSLDINVSDVFCIPT